MDFTQWVKRTTKHLDGRPATAVDRVYAQDEVATVAHALLEVLMTELEHDGNLNLHDLGKLYVKRVAHHIVKNSTNGPTIGVARLHITTSKRMRERLNKDKMADDRSDTTHQRTPDKEPLRTVESLNQHTGSLSAASRVRLNKDVDLE